MFGNSPNALQNEPDGTVPSGPPESAVGDNGPAPHLLHWEENLILCSDMEGV